MSEYPTLTVDGDPWDWTGDDIFDPSRNTVRIDGDLPTVTDIEAGGGVDVFGLVRALRVGDKVTLATRHVKQHQHGRTERDIPFATATVAKVQPVKRIVARRQVTDRWLVTVSDVEALR
jgi:hypothetical protein